MLFSIVVPLYAALASAVPGSPQGEWPIDPPPRFFITFGDSYSQTGFNILSTKPSINNPFGNPAFPGYTIVNNGINWFGEATHSSITSPTAVPQSTPHSPLHINLPCSLLLIK